MMALPPFVLTRARTQTLVIPPQYALTTPILREVAVNPNSAKGGRLRPIEVFKRFSSLVLGGVVRDSAVKVKVNNGANATPTPT